jgi:hypothetical protein
VTISKGLLINLLQNNKLLFPQRKSTSITPHHLSFLNMSILGNPTQESPERGFALQKYLLLHLQHDALQRHLDSLSQASSTAATSSSGSPLSGSPPLPAYFSTSYHNHQHKRHVRSSTFSNSFIPELPQSTNHDSPDAPPSRPNFKQRRSSLPSNLTVTPALSEIEEEEQKLQDVNQQIKTTLTELLNCESVRGDWRYRMWVQTRLMDAERELKVCRSRSRSRRRSSADYGHGQNQV